MNNINNGAPFYAEKNLVYGADGLLCETFHVSDAQALANVLNKQDALINAAKILLSKRSATEAVYDQSYDFLFKSWGRDEWDSLTDVSGWTEEEGHKWRTDNDCLMDGEEPFKIPLSVSFAEHMKEGK